MSNDPSNRLRELAAEPPQSLSSEPGKAWLSEVCALFEAISESGLAARAKSMARAAPRRSKNRWLEPRGYIPPAPADPSEAERIAKIVDLVRDTFTRHETKRTYPAEPAGPSKEEVLELLRQETAIKVAEIQAGATKTAAKWGAAGGLASGGVMAALISLAARSCA